MKKIKRKLRSEKGASITFALLIFLVCAVISSVVLVAATTASGRISREAETDQRYYSVTSAAELLKEMIDGKSATVIKVVTETTTTNYFDNNNNADNGSNKNEEETPTSDPTPGTLSSVLNGDGSDGNEEEETSTQDSTTETLYVVEKPIRSANPAEDDKIPSTGLSSASIVRTAAYEYYLYQNSDHSDSTVDSDSTSGRALTLTSDATITVGDSSVSASAINTEVKVEFDKRTGTMNVTIGGGFKVVLVFQAQVETDQSTTSSDGPHIPVDSGYTVETTTITTTKTGLTWTLTDTRVV